jgi:glycosyltransferase involved in cell wall biosynthesis
LSGHNWPFKTINWIPDFQHLHLPEVFSDKDLALRDLKFKQWITRSDMMVLSSQAAFEDYQQYMPGYENKVRVLHFVSQVDPAIYEMGSCQELYAKHGLPVKFFYLPNQFWRHKNHLTVFKAVEILKKQGHQICVVCTGKMEDYRNRDHFDGLVSFIKQKELNDNIRILGLIDYQEVQCLMRYAVSVINPSFFEGWSSTVEEAKSMGKNMILSDLPVHREQNPPDGLFFDPHSAEQLADRMLQKWASRSGGPDYSLEDEARRALPVRTREFAFAYKNILYEARGFLQP